MRGHYVFNPFDEEPMLAGVMMIIVTSAAFEAFANTLITIRYTQDGYFAGGDEDIDFILRAFEWNGLLIREMRLAAKSFWELWILYKMIAYSIFTTLGIDVGRTIYMED